MHQTEAKSRASSTLQTRSNTTPQELSRNPIAQSNFKPQNPTSRCSTASPSQFQQSPKDPTFEPLTSLEQVTHSFQTHLPASLETIPHSSTRTTFVKLITTETDLFV
ncbi:hypothetical protein Droror1_Dr00023197 [Drosera rotundifolia]